MLGSDKDPTWRDFPQAVTETRGARHCVTLFEAPFEASVLSDHENNALRASSLMAVPPPAPGMPSLAGLTTVDLMGASLTQWASHIQDVTSGMRMNLEAAVNCPQEGIMGVLNWLERLTPVKYCRLCFGVGKKCRCTNVPHQTPSQGSALWMPPTMSYTTMASPTDTTASSSVGGVPPLRYPPPGLPPGDPAPMDTLPAPTTENLLATSGVGRGGRGWRSPAAGPWTPTAPGPNKCHLRPTSSRCPPQEGTRRARRPLTDSRFIRLNTPLGRGWPPPRRTLLPAPVRVVMRQPEGVKVPEVDPHPEGLKAKPGEIDPPPEDLGNVAEASSATIPWTMSPTMWPQAGKKTSST